MNTTLLEKLIHAHATPGDESTVAEILSASWQGAGLATTRLGSRAVFADTAPGSRKPVLLITAHMDSCGFAIDRFLDKNFGLTSLGHPNVAKASTPAVLKTRAGLFPGTLRRKPRKNNEPDFLFQPKPGVCPDAQHGDRVAFAPMFSRDGKKISAPFPDRIYKADMPEPQHPSST